MKAQATVFIILGIVIVSVFTSLFYVAETLSDYTTEKKAEKIIESYFDVSSFKQTISYCLSLSTIEATNILASQGGYIFPNQMTSMFNNEIPKIETEHYNVSYAIFAEALGVNLPPEYPCHDILGSRYSYPCYFSHYKKGYIFGVSNPLLHPSNNIPPLYKKYIEGFAFYFNYNYSMQEQLERLILNMTLNCANLSLYSEKFNYKVSTGNPIVNLTIGKNDLQVKMDYPFIVNISQDRVIKSYEFFTMEKIRFRLLWEQANAMLSLDKKRIDYDITDITLPIDVEIKKSKIGTTHIISLEDDTYTLRNKPFTFSVAVEDREPALDCLGSCDGDEYDYIIPVNSTFTLKPYGIDPDEEEVLYIYTGWKADYVELWPTNISEFGSEIPIENNSWQESELFSNGGLCNYPTYKEVNGKNRCAQIQVNTSDIGPHEMTLYVRDPDNPGLYDIQIIKILVDAVALPNIDNLTPYEDINGNVASIEDPIFLDASNSKKLLGGEIYFVWNDNLDGMFVNTSLENLTYPFNPYIMNITNVPFNTTGRHILQLQIFKPNSNLTSEKAQSEIDVYQCLPHRTNLQTAPYPYNNVDYDDYYDITQPFMANHACCKNDTGGWGSVLGSETTCYQYTTLGCRAIVDDLAPLPKGYIVDEQNYVWPSTLAINITLNPALPYFDDLISSSPDHINDIYIRDFNQKCSGERGNICNGPQEDNWNHHKECSICQYCSWDSADCKNYNSGIICETQKKCVSHLGINGFSDIIGKTDIVAVGLCNGNGGCNSTAGSPGMTKTMSNKSVYPNGLYDESEEYMISENCNSYDIADVNENHLIETCLLEDWTCTMNPTANCGIESEYPLTIDCNNMDFPAGSHSPDDDAIVDELEDTCEWIDYGVNSSSCSMYNQNIYTINGCSPDSQSACCEIEQLANITSMQFDCDSLDIISSVNGRLVESEATSSSCKFGDIRAEGCNITDVTCTASNLCMNFTNFTNYELDELEDYTCIYKNPVVGFNWSKTIPPIENYCYDGFDNDCDGLIDCMDDDCYNKRCEFNSIEGICVQEGICEIEEICNLTNSLKSKCSGCGLGYNCMIDVFYPYQEEGICVSGSPAFCANGTICQDTSLNYQSTCGSCSEGDLCDIEYSGYFNANGICTDNGCCDSTLNDTVNTNFDYFCGCDSALNNIECDIKDPTPSLFEIDGHCQEQTCCELAEECNPFIEKCDNIACDQDTDCKSYVDRDSDTCFYGHLGSGSDGDCTQDCNCSYNNVTATETLSTYGISSYCEYGYLFASYCLTENQCIHSCSCGIGGWSCNQEECPEPGTNINQNCYFETFLERSDDCTPSTGCNLEMEENPSEFMWNECTQSSTIFGNYFCYINTQGICYYNDIDACHQIDGWVFNSDVCYNPGTIDTNNYCWYGFNTCDSTGCLSDFTTQKRTDCSYHSLNCPGENCMYYYDMTGENCDMYSGWSCFYSDLDSSGQSCEDYDYDGICNNLETNPCEKGENLPECQLGEIIGFNETNFLPMDDKVVDITIKNTGIHGTLILEPLSYPSGIEVDDMEIDGNNFKQINLDSMEQINIQYRIITTTTAGFYQIAWKLSYDVLGPSNKELDTDNQDIFVSNP